MMMGLSLKAAGVINIQVVIAYTFLREILRIQMMIRRMKKRPSAVTGDIYYPPQSF
jgi:hypothetical protein